MPRVQPPATAEGLRTKVQTGDLLISITADLGRTAVVDRDTARRGAYINQHLALVRLKKSILPEYVSAFLESQGGRQQFKRLDQVGVKSGLNFDSIRSLRIPVPSVDAQQYFVKTKATIQRAKTKIFALSDAADTLFASLAQRAFRGEL